MANYPSSIKRIRSTKKRYDRNKGQRSAVRTAVKKVEAAVAAGKKDDALSLLKSAVKALDTATGKGIYKKNTGARGVSRLTRKVNAMN